jgi:hypothetical protein
MSQATLLDVRSAASYDRRRAGNACNVCRVRKTKCDNHRPKCGFCVATGGDCRYIDSNPSQFDRASLAILERISNLESSLIHHIDQVVKNRPAADEDSKMTAGFPPAVDHAWTHPASIDQHAFLNASYKGIPPSAFSRGSTEPSNVNQNFDEEMNGEATENSPPSSSVLLQASEMFVDSVLQWPIFSEYAPHLAGELYEPILKVMARPARQTTFTSESMNSMGATLHNLNLDVLNALIANFLANNHIKNPVLDVQTLRIDVIEFAESGPRWDGKSCLLVGSISSSTILNK